MEKVLSRWSNERRTGDDGKPEAFVFHDRDLEICKLLVPNADVRRPWSYHYLTTNYIVALTLRGKYVKSRLRKLTWAPGYLEKPEQPRNNYRDIIYAIGKAGISELIEAGHIIPKHRARRLPYELMANLIAGSFEIGTHEHSIGITPYQIFALENIKPEWPVFRAKTDHHAVDVILEADTASEAPHTSDDQATSIEGKCEEYLGFLRDGKLLNPMILFVTTKVVRHDSMIVRLKEVIDRHHLDHDLAGHFGFMAITYDRYLNKLPKPPARLSRMTGSVPIKPAHSTFSNRRRGNGRQDQEAYRA